MEYGSISTGEVLANITTFIESGEVKLKVNRLNTSSSMSLLIHRLILRNEEASESITFQKERKESMRLTWFDGNNAEDGHRIYVSTRVIKENLKDNNNINLIPYIEKTGDKQSLGNITILSSEVSEILYFGDKQAVYNSTTKVLTINGRTVGNIKVNGHEKGKRNFNSNVC